MEIGGLVQYHRQMDPPNSKVVAAVGAVSAQVVDGSFGQVRAMG